MEKGDVFSLFCGENWLHKVNTTPYSLWQFQDFLDISFPPAFKKELYDAEGGGAGWRKREDTLDCARGISAFTFNWFIVYL